VVVRPVLHLAAALNSLNKFTRNFNMLLNEMFNDNNGDFQDLSQDNSVAKPRDLRKVKLTLAQINQLRKMNDQRNVEYAEEITRVRKQYGATAAPQPGL